MIEITNVNKSYRMGDNILHVLKNVSLRIDQGEFVAIIGQSGSGKSTLLNLIGLLDRPDDGELTIDGHGIASLNDDELAQLRSESIGFVFQQFHLLQRLTAKENVELPLIYAKGSKPPADAHELLMRVGIGNRETHKPNELSGGQQQRVAIARALIRNPAILLADEPTGNLDTASGDEIIRLLRELHAAGLTVVLVTHEPSIAENADRVIRVQDGQVVEDTRKPNARTYREKAVIKAEGHAISSFAPWLVNFQQAYRSLVANKLRTCLSALGIVIGVGAVIAMLALGSGAESSVKNQISGLGSNRLTIRPNSQNVGGVRSQIGNVSRLNLSEADQVKSSIATVAAVAPIVRGRVQAVFGENNTNTEIDGTTPSYLQVYAATPTYGRFFTQEECDQRARVALLGQTVSRTLFDTANPIGQTIKINHSAYIVIGILPSKGSTGPRDEDDVIVAPLQTVMHRLLGKTYIDQIDVSATDPDTVQQTQDRLEALMREWPRVPGITGDSYQVRNFASVQEAFTAVAKTLSYLLAAVAAISLVVGGIGIMNIMLVSVTERTREIGLRKALGARRKDIQTQFLIEAVVLCLAGGITGIVLGWISTLIIGHFAGWALSPSLFAVLLSCGFSAGVGIAFGFWPAMLASKLDPIEALRHD